MDLDGHDGCQGIWFGKGGAIGYGFGGLWRIICPLGVGCGMDWEQREKGSIWLVCKHENGILALSAVASFTAD